VGQSGYFVQNVQLLQRRQDARRSRTNYQATLEKLIIKELLSQYGGRDEEVVIRNDVYCYTEVEDLRINFEYLGAAFGNFKELRVGRFGLHVSY
jgi:hypothetical protein